MASYRGRFGKNRKSSDGKCEELDAAHYIAEPWGVIPEIEPLLRR